MEIRQLNYFVKAAETLNFTEAAKISHITQSTLSQQIKQLENSLDIELFHRIGKRVVLTEAGKTFYVYAKQILAKAEQSKKTIQDLNNLEYGELRIGITYALRNIIIQAITAFNIRYPKIKFNITFATTDELIDKTKKLEFDFTASFLDENYIDEELLFEPILHCPIVYVQSKLNALINKKKIRLVDLEQIPLALPEKRFSTRQHLESVFKLNKINPNIVMEINDIAALFQLIETGHWATITSEITLNNNENLEVLPIIGIGKPREASIITAIDIVESKAVKEFKQIVKQTITSLSFS